MTETLQIKHLLIRHEDIAAIISRRYPIGHVQGCVLEKSAPNAVYKIVAEKGSYAFKLYNGATSNIAFEAEFIAHLEMSAIGVSTLVAGSDGKPFSTINGFGSEFCGLLTRYAPGRILEPDSDSDAVLYGEQLALLHGAGNDFTPRSPCPSFEIKSRLNHLLPSIERRLLYLGHSDAWREYRRMADHAIELIDCICDADMKMTYIHGDTHGGNAKVSDGTLKFFDFENACYGPIAFDLANFKWATLVGKRRTGWESFLAGYQSVAQVSVPDILAIDVLAMLKEIEVLLLQLELADFLGAWFVTDRYLGMRIAALARLVAECSNGGEI